MTALLPYLSGVQLERAEPGDDLVSISVRTVGGVPRCCPACGSASAREHSRYARQVADLGIGGRAVLIEVCVRRMYCPNPGCPKATFVEQVPGLTERYQRRTPALRGTLEALAVALAGRAGARVAGLLGYAVSWMTMLNLLMRVRLPHRPVPRVLCVDDFALRRGHRYGSLLLDAVTHQRVEVLADRKAATLAAWLCEHPGVQIVCRDGSATYAEAVTAALPAAVQVSDRWHLWHGLGGAVERTVLAHASCWNSMAPKTESVRAAQTRERFEAVHALRNQGLGLLECTRRLGMTINCVKKYAHAERVEDLLRPPQYRATLVDPYRALVAARLNENTPIAGILAEIRTLGYQGAPSLLDRFIAQGRATGAPQPPSARRLTSWIMTRPGDLKDQVAAQLEELVGACPEMTALACCVRQFARILTERRGNELTDWINRTRALKLPGFDQYLNGLEKDREASIAGLTQPYSNGPCEGANTKVKLIKRQTYGRAGFALLRHRILLN
jgi:transposase